MRDKIFPGLIALAIGVIVYFVSRTTIFTDTDRVAFAAGLTTFLIGLQITVWFILVKGESTIVDCIEKTEGNQRNLQRIVSQSSCERELTTILNSAANVFSDSHPFFKRRAADALFRLSGDLSTLASGRYTCTPEEELQLTKEVLSADTCCNSLKAVSYQDEAWWESTHGEVYLNKHSALAAAQPSLMIQRIFVAKNPGDSRLRKVLEAHERVGIKPIVLEEELVPADLRRDFVLYDSKLLRTAEKIESGVAKSALFSTVQGEVAKAEREYNTLLEIAAARDAKKAKVESA